MAESRAHRCSIQVLTTKGYEEIDFITGIEPKQVELSTIFRVAGWSSQNPNRRFIALRSDASHIWATNPTNKIPVPVGEVDNLKHPQRLWPEKEERYEKTSRTPGGTG